jgi:molybdopterin-binding protein
VKISARNRLKGTIVEVKAVQAGYAIIKASDAMVGLDR